MWWKVLLSTIEAGMAFTLPRLFIQSVHVSKINNNNNHVSRISELKIHKACRHLKRGKVARLDGVTSEHILCGAKPVVMALKALFNLVLVTETCPNDWKQSIIVPIYTGKGKRKDDPGSYRPVSLISVLFERIIYNRLQGDILTHFSNRQQQVASQLRSIPKRQYITS